MELKPLHDRVLVRPMAEDDKTSGGIIIPETAQEKPQRGEIIAVGSGIRKDSGETVALDVKKGDKVLYGKYSGTEIKLDGQDLLIMREADILGVLQ